MAVVDHTDKTFNQLLSFGLSEPTFSNNSIEKFSTGDYFLDKTVHVRLIVEFVKADNVRVIHLTENGDFVHDQSLVFFRKFLFL